MITHLAKERLSEGAYAAAARQQALTRFLAERVPGSVEHFSRDHGEAAEGGVKALRGLFAGVRVVWGSGNRWVLVDYPNHPASVPRRPVVFLAACAYLAALRTACLLRGAKLAVQSEDDPAMQDEWLGGQRLGRVQLLLERTYERMLYGAAERVWFSGDTAAAILCELFSIPPSKATCVPNGAPKPAPVTVPLPDAAFRFVYAGSLRPDTHRVRELLASFSDVRLPGARLVLLGPDGEWVPDHLAHCGDDRIDYLGCLSGEEAQGVVASCDAGVLTGDRDSYHSSGFPGKLGAYLAAGLPVIASCGGDTERLIAERGVGVHCERETMGRAMDTLASDPEVYDALRRNAEAGRGEYAWDAIFERAVATMATPTTRSARMDAGQTARTADSG